MYVFLLAGWLFAAGSLGGMQCENSGSPNVLRIDEGTGKIARIFVQKPTSEVEKFRSVRKARLYVSCLRKWVKRNRPQWGSRWRASVFSDARYAGYKDEEKLRLYVLDGTWPENYLAEYDEESELLLLYPALSKKVVSVRLKAVPSSKQK